jgi:[ribosomal protein S5]-alanine N-acetyltransferase
VDEIIMIIRMIENILITERLILEKLNLDDLHFIISLVNSKGWIDNIGDRNIHSENDATKYIGKLLGTENLFYWVIRLKDIITPIGIVSFLKRSYLENFDIGFALLPDFKNKGYAFEASKAVLSMVSNLPEHNIILATTKPSNKSSIKLLTKLGFGFVKMIEIENEKLHVYSNEKKVLL